MKRSIFSLASAILGSVYLLAAMYVYSMNGAFYSAIIHMVFAAVAVAANWAGFLYDAKDGILVSAAAYCMAAVAFLPYSLLLVLPAALSIYAFTRMRQAEAAGAPAHPRTARTAARSHMAKGTSAQETAPASILCKLRLTGTALMNSDGVSRQALLQRMRLYAPPFDGGWDIELHRWYADAQPAITILVNGYAIGDIAPAAVPHILSNWNRIEGIADFKTVTDGNQCGAEIYLQLRPSARVPAGTARS